MQFIYSMPFWSCPPNPAFLSQEAIIALSVAAEESGFAAVSFTEHPIPDQTWRETGGHDGLDPFVALAIASAVTKRLRLLTYLCVVPYRNPFLLAKTVATLDALSGGRLIFGAGVGYQEAEYAALGVDYAERNALFDEALAAMKLAWRGAPFDLEGRHFSARNVAAMPQPAQRPHPPIWIGGNSKLTLRRVAEGAQGWLAMPATPQQAVRRRSVEMVGLEGLAAKIGDLRAHAEAIGRTEPIVIHAPLPGHGDEPQDMAADAAMVRDLAGLGVTWCNWGGTATDLAGAVDEIRRFGDAVIAQAGVVKATALRGM